jgi:hypothetical protein
VVSVVFHGPSGGDIAPMDKPGTYYHIDGSAAGTYETNGSNGAIGECIWQRWRSPDDDRAVEVGTVQQTTRVTLHAGEYFVSYGCLPWRYVG